MIAILLSSLYRVQGHPTYRGGIAFLGNFGFYKDGTLNVSWDNTPGGENYTVVLRIFPESQFDHWYTHTYQFDLWFTCPPLGTPNTLSANLTDTIQTGELVIPTSDIYYVIIQACNNELAGQYFADVRFLNPGDQHLDSRDIPSLTVLPCVIPIFSALLTFWIVYITIKRAKFLKIHVCFGIIVAAYIVYLAVLYVNLRQASSTDSSRAFPIYLAIVHVIYQFALYSTLIVASNGWCLLNVTNTVGGVASSAIGVAVYVIAVAIQSESSLGNWKVFVVLIEFVAIAWMVRTIAMNCGQAVLHIKAHLLVIQQEGIVPSSTPIYKKMELYSAFMYFVSLAFMMLIVINVISASLPLAFWAFRLIDNVMQLGIVTVIMWLYRPRGKNIDQYMERDERTNEERQRGEVLLEDINDFTPTAQQDGMREWEEGMDLPLEPLVISSREPRAGAGQSREEPRHERVDIGVQATDLLSLELSAQSENSQ
jgi:hypothetical protein